jgi:phage/plasmid-associated DNA primase
MANSNPPNMILAIKSISSKITDETKHERITCADLQSVNNYFEIVRHNQPQRVFIDLDGEIFDKTENDFYDLNKKIQNALMSYDPLSGIRTSSKYQAKIYTYNKDTKQTEIKIKNKISFVILYKKMTADVATMREWIIKEELPRLQTLFQGIIPITTYQAPDQINIDTSVYPHVDKTHKMRCPNAYKNYQDKTRISKIIKGDLSENIIQNVTNCEIIPPIVQIIPHVEVQQVPISSTTQQTTQSAKIITTDFNVVLREVCDTIPHNKWYNTPDWININFIWKNEGWDYKVFDEFSKKYGGDKYHEKNNKRIWEGIQKKSGLTQATLWEWLKQVNKDKFNDLQFKRSDFYLMIENNVNNLDLAILYYNIQPNKYAYSKVSKWWEYRPSNILVNTGDEKPTSLINNIGFTLREYFNEQRKLLNPDDKEFKEKNECIMKIYSKLGQSSFCKGVIDFLPDLYYNDKIEEMVDRNTNVIAFNNMLYDLETNEFRNIKPDDYVCRTCGYDINTKKDPTTRDEITKIIEGIFPDKDTREYYLKATALSFFSNRFENFYVLTGKGRNGKGVLDKLIKVALGKYHYTAEPTFLTTIIRAGVPNPTLSECNGIRYLSVAEPDNGAENCCLNVEFVKGLTGRDKITSRGLYEKNKTFENTFSVFLQCNNKPTLNKLDKAIVERLKCIPFTERFLSNPDLTDDHQHPVNDKLKDVVGSQKYINEFMLYMFEIAFANKNIEGCDFKVSELCKQSTDEYVEENNAFKFWFNSKYQKQVMPSKEEWKKMTKEDQEKYKIKTRTSALLNEYNEGKQKHEHITSKKLRNALSFNDIEVHTSSGISVIKGYEHKPEEVEENPINKIINDLDK